MLPRLLFRRTLVNSIVSLGSASALAYGAHAFGPRLLALEQISSPLDPRVRRVPSTDVDFPARIHPASVSSASSLPLCLVGAGVRTVSFLGIKVYCAGLYLPEHLLRRLKYHVAWKNYSAHSFNSENQSELFLNSLLDEPTDIAIRIVPTRSTDFTHLRDGFVRGVTARLKASGQIDSAAPALQQLQSLFPKKSLPKGAALLLIHDAQGGLVVEYDGHNLGRLDDKLVSRELFLAYFANQKPISAPFKASVANGLQALFEHEQ